MATDFTIQDVLEWARTKPAGEVYCYTDNGRCALAQYLVAKGMAKKPSVGPRIWFDLGGDGYGKVPAVLDDAVEAEQTFGALVTRLESLVQETPAKLSPWLNPQTYVDADCGEHVL